MTSALRLAHRMPDRILLLGWEMDGYHLHCPLHLLFENVPPVVSPAFFAHTGYIHHHDVSASGVSFVNVGSQADIVWMSQENFFYAQGEDGAMLGQHGPHKMVNGQLRADLLASFAALKPHPMVASRVDTFARLHFSNQPVVGVHIRRGDNAWANTWCPDRLFPAVVRRVLDTQPDAVLFICSDSAESEASLLQEFGSRVLTYPHRSLDRGRSWEAVQDALVEMYLLARTKVIIRTPSSTFSQCAAWLGNLETVEVGPLEHTW